jgi:uncharacterized protein (DUF433 family)
VDLRAPRPRLRIVPGKVAGEPHLVGSRLTTRTVAALAARGFSAEQIAALYMHEDPAALAEAVELERSLAAWKPRPVALDHHFTRRALALLERVAEQQGSSAQQLMRELSP